MGISDSKNYDESKVNIFIFGNTQGNINSRIINSLFQNGANEYKTMVDLGDSQEYIFLSRQMIAETTIDSINRVKATIEGSQNKKNIIVLFSNDENLIWQVKNTFTNLNQDIMPFILFVRNNQYSQNIDEYKKIKMINVIKYFGRSLADVNNSNSSKTGEIFRSKILQIDGYYNERGTIFRDYLFGLLNRINNIGEVIDNNANNISIEEMMPGNRSTLNIFLFGQARSGKSRFINLSMNEKIAYENYSAYQVTKKFTKYELPMSHNNNGELGQIVLHDAPGNTDDNRIYEDFKKILNQTLTVMKERKDNAAILLYFIKKDGNGLTKTALEFIKFIDLKFNIIFVITFSKRNTTNSISYRNSVINILSVNNILTGKNLEMLRNSGQNVINVNLKEDEEHGEFYGFKEIYKEIKNIFPQNFSEMIDEGIHLNDLNQLIGYLNYRNFFFLENCRTIEDFIINLNSKIDRTIKISAGLCSVAGLIPIPFGDVPIVIASEIVLIKYIAKLYEINEEDYNTFKLSTLGPTGSWSALGWNVLSKVAFLFNILDIVPFLGEIVSAAANPAAVYSFGESIKKHFLPKAKNKERFVLSLIKNVLKDFNSIYAQIDELSERDNINLDV